MRKSIFICLAIFILLGCAQIINKIRVDNINKKRSMLIAGTPRSDIIKTLGNPVIKEGDYIDYYSLCLPEKPTEYIFSDILTIGATEFIGIPIEIYLAMKDCPIKEDFVLIYDKNEKLKQIFKKYYYDRLVSIYKTLCDKVDECSANKNLSLIYFDYENGWFYISKNEIICNLQGKFTKIYITEIPSVKKQYELLLLLKDVPETINKTINLDYGNDQLKISSIILYNENGQLIDRLPDQDWIEINPDSYIKIIADRLEYYCLSGNFREYQQNEKPQLLDFLLNF